MASVREAVCERDREEIEERGKEQRWWDHWSESLCSVTQLYLT